MGSSFDTKEAVMEYLRSIAGLDDERYSGVSHWLEDVLIGSAEWFILSSGYGTERSFMKYPQESPLDNGQILIDGQVLIRLMLSKGMISGISDKISQVAREESQGVSWIRWLSAHGWNRKAKEKINLQKDVQVSTQALEQVRDFDSKLGSQLKTIDEGDGYSDWQWDCHIPFIRRDVYVH
ncbi:hypothetical protein F2Q69_00004782 [Brassica cretica]|uniref:Uncharacterized protein n=1 Tax=Brassica cretica TaxID=69181 RepID=A0A8S9P9Q4_BRACR|nr:hypothetical protein F2Q69_00004782 [Brassica cretica]